jgi:hypothetical protein
MFRNAVVVSLILVGAICASGAVAGPSMSIGWEDTTLSQKDCLEKARAAVRSVGYTTNFETTGDTVYGESGDYTAAVRCAASKTIAMFVVAGPKVDRTSGTLKSLRANFSK